MLCSGVNYRGHLEENPGATLPETPGFFAKLPNAVIGPGQAIVHPRLTQQLDYEVELAVIIGRRLRRISEHDVMAGIQGYTIAPPRPRDQIPRAPRCWRLPSRKVSAASISATRLVALRSADARSSRCPTGV